MLRLVAFSAATLFACAHAAAPPARAYADVNGVHMYYEVHGQGFPVLMLHGGISDQSFWSGTVQAISQGHQVIAPEQMGHGHTPDVPAREFSYEQMAEDTAALLQQLHVQRTDVVGWSDGGVIGYLLAIRHPELVRKLVTSGSNIDDEGLPSPKSDKIKPEQLPKMFQERYDQVSPDGPQHYEALINRVAAMWRRYPYVERSRLAQIHCPTLIIMGDRDFYSVEVAHHIAKDIPGAQLLIVPGSGHATFRTRPELVNLAVIEFLEAPLK